MSSGEALQNFTGITGASEQQARFYLESSNGDLETAVATYYEQQGAGGQDDDAPMEDVAPSASGGSAEAPVAHQDEDADLASALAASAADDGLPTPTQPQTLGGGQPSQQQPSQQQGGGLERGAYTLSGAPAPALPAGWGGNAGGSGNNSGSSSRSATPSNPMRSNQPPRVTGFRDLASSSSAPAPSRGGIGRVPHNDDDSDGEDDKEGQEFFTGGEKSGLSVQNPNAGKGREAGDMIKGILQKAKEGGSRMAGLAGLGGGQEQQQPQRQVFTGGAHTLGSDETPSQFIPAPSSSSAGSRMPGSLGGAIDSDEEDDGEDSEEPVIRNLTFWQDGFSIDDGDLMGYEDPKNQEILRAIDGGRAPLSLLRVRHDQPVELRIAKRLTEKWTRQPGPPKGPWEGEGRRLGSVEPSSGSVSVSGGAGAAALGSSEGAGGAQSGTRAPQGAVAFEVDASQPTTQLQIRLRDGERMVARFNHTHTIGDIRNYINAAHPGQSHLSYALQTTFPSRDLTDDAQSIKDAGLLGSVVVQRGL